MVTGFLPDTSESFLNFFDLVVDLSTFLPAFSLYMFIGTYDSCIQEQ